MRVSELWRSINEFGKKKRKQIERMKRVVKGAHAHSNYSSTFTNECFTVLKRLLINGEGEICRGLSGRVQKCQISLVQLNEELVYAL